MASTTKEKGSTMSGAQDMGNKMAESAAKTATSGIQEHMDVIACCGTKMGVVDRVEGNAIKLTKKDSPDNQHHFIPTDWVEEVDSQVHLKKNSKETEQEWKSDAASCGCS